MRDRLPPCGRTRVLSFAPLATGGGGTGGSWGGPALREARGSGVRAQRCCVQEVEVTRSLHVVFLKAFVRILCAGSKRAELLPRNAVMWSARSSEKLNIERSLLVRP